MTQVVDKKPADPILVDLCNRFGEEYRNYKKQEEQIECKHENAKKALKRELYALVGLQPKDKVLYKGEEHIIDDVYMPYLAENEKYRTEVHVTAHNPRSTYFCIDILFNENEEIIKL